MYCKICRKKIINPSFVISDGCIVLNTGNFIHLNAPFTLTPTPGIKTAANPTIEITQIGFKILQVSYSQFLILLT